MNIVFTFIMQSVRAFVMVNELQKMNLEPTTAMYNSILAGYFREVSLLDFVDTYSCSDFQLFIKLDKNALL